jgi:hypothetical protein
VTNPFPFVAGATLTAAELNAIGEYQTWTPTFSGVTGQPTISLAVYAEVNELVFWSLYVEFDAADLPLTGSLRCTAPTNTSSAMTYNPMGQGWVRPAGSTIYQGTNIATGNNIFFYCHQVTGSFTTAANVTNTAPATWTSSGDMWAMGMYRSA